jgi:hypothetical protein
MGMTVYVFTQIGKFVFVFVFVFCLFYGTAAKNEKMVTVQNPINLPKKIDI